MSATSYFIQSYSNAQKQRVKKIRTSETGVILMNLRQAITIYLLFIVWICVLSWSVFASETRAEHTELSQELMQLQKEDKLTVRALRGWGELPERFMRLAMELRRHDLDILGADQAGIKELAGQAGEDDLLSEYASDLQDLADFMAGLVPAEPEALDDVQKAASKTTEPSVSLPPDGVPGWVLASVDKSFGETSDRGSNTYSFDLHEGKAVDRSQIRQSGNGYSRDVYLAFDFSWQQPPAYVLTGNIWEGQLTITDTGNRVEYLRGSAPEIDPQSGGFAISARYRAGEQHIRDQGSAATGRFSPDNPDSVGRPAGEAEIRWPDQGCPGDEFTVEMRVRGWAGFGTIKWSYEYHPNILRSPLFKEQYLAMQESFTQSEDQTVPEMEVIQDCPECPEMVVLPTGSFQMGSLESEHGRGDNEGPVRTVRVEQAFAMAKTPVTQSQWLAVMDSNPSRFDDCDNCPVENVTIHQANKFLSALSEKTGQEYRLPSEAEWEYACKAGHDHRYCGGNDINEVAWYQCNSEERTHPVASRSPNTFGLYDMSGNVSEWTRDCYNDSYAEAPEDATPMRRGDCQNQVTRGGHWGSFENHVRSAARNRGRSMIAGRDGLRPVRMVKDSAEETIDKEQADKQEVLEEKASEHEVRPKKSSRQFPADSAKKEYTALGISFQAPERLIVIADEEDEFVLGDPDWERMFSDYRFDEPLGMMIVVGTERHSNLGFLNDDHVQQLPETVMLGNKTFEQYHARETKEYEQREAHAAGYVLLARTPSKGGQYLVLMVTYVGQSAEDALQQVKEVAGSFKAVKPAAFTDEIPITAGLDSMLHMRIPQGMVRNWDRSDYFRIQTYNSPYSYFQIKTHEYAREDMQRELRNAPEDSIVSRKTFQGYSIIDIQRHSEDWLFERKVFERCLPEGEPIIVTLRLKPEFSRKMGGQKELLKTLELNLPADMDFCPPDVLEPFKTHLGIQ